MKNGNWFSKTKIGKEIKWNLKKILKLEIKKIWLKTILKKMWLRRYDWKDIVLKRYDWKDMIEKQFKKIWFLKLMTWLTRNLKDMIQTLNLSQQKRQHTWNVESNH